MATKVAIEVDVKVGDAGENLSNVKILVLSNRVGVARASKMVRNV